MLSEVNEHGFALSAITPRFLLYAHVELRFAPQSIQKYTDCLRQVHLMVGDVDVRAFQKPELMRLKAVMLARGNGECRQSGILLALKRLLVYCRDEENLAVFAPESITVPRRPRREVAYLSAEEIDRFVSAIRLRNLDGSVSVTAVRFRALVEVLLGTAMRISEILSLNSPRLIYLHVKLRSSAREIRNGRCFSPSAPFHGSPGILSYARMSIRLSSFDRTGGSV